MTDNNDLPFIPIGHVGHGFVTHMDDLGADDTCLGIVSQHRTLTVEVTDLPRDVLSLLTGIPVGLLPVGPMGAGMVTWCPRRRRKRRKAAR